MAGFFDVIKLPPVPVPGGDYPTFNRISIETLSYCNRSCHFCPVAWNDRGKTPMKPELFTKIATELGELKFDGVAQLFLLSEPTLDKLLPERATLVRKNCPEVSIYISSNGDTFDALYKSRGIQAALDRLKMYYDAGINVININVYDNGPDQLARYRYIEAAAQDVLGCRPTENKYRHHSNKRWLCITDMRFNEREESGKAKGTDLFYIRNKQDRAALAASGTQVKQTHCARTQRHIVVLFDGTVPICCAIDPTDKSLIVGDINSQTLKSVWESEVFYKYRYYTQQAQRVLPGCDTCTHKMAFPHIVRKVAPSDELISRWAKEQEARQPSSPTSSTATASSNPI